MSQIQQSIRTIAGGGTLDKETARAVMESIMRGDADEVEMAALLAMLRLRGEQPSELLGFAETMLEHTITSSSSMNAAPCEPLLDTCGTGGDGLATFNVSTAAAFVVAAAGVRVAKHGNRAQSSHCGSADVLEAAGVAINLSANEVSRCIDEVGIGFLFAQTFYPAMRHVAPVRRRLGFRTVFNILGPVCNPMHATHRLLGVFSEGLLEPLANVLKKLGVHRAMVVRGLDGLDEISVCAPTRIVEWNGSEIFSHLLKPEQVGLKRRELHEIQVGNDPQKNAELMRNVLEGDSGATLDLVLINAAAALKLASKVPSIADGLEIARSTVQSGKAIKKLDELIELSQQIAK